MPELEKLTVNIGPVDLGQIEVLVAHGFYANRAEFIRLAIQNQLLRHGDTIREVAARDTFVIGALSYGRSALEQLRQSGVRLGIRVIGLLSLGEDVDADLAREVIESVQVRGIFRAPPDVKSALADRTR